jgi:outer membrane protein OmpA-like peptidoglycan-associated protein/tetratricopeptide (TPR) repeat protein
MKAIKFFCSICVLIVLAFYSEAQNNNFLINKGDKFYKKEQYKNAYPFYEQALKSDSLNIEAQYKAAVCNLHRFSKEDALRGLEKVYNADSTYNKYLYYWMGRAYHLNFKFEEAILFYSKAQQKKSKNNNLFEEVERYKYQVRCARDYVSNPSNFNVVNLGGEINSSYSDHSPITSYTDTMLLFTSRRVNQLDVKEEYDGEPFEDIFYSYKNTATGTWSTPISFHLNTTGHDASVQLFDNDTKLFIYSYLHEGDINLVEKKNGEWGTPMPVDQINTIDFEADAFMTADGKTLYYATNHFKKNGDLDICYIVKSGDGTWSKPKTLSSLINTDEDEDAPYITADGRTMYFSSRGHSSMGGYDVFKSELDTISGEWMKPENLGYPVNTPDEDLYYCISSKSTKAYLSSYRSGGFGEKDIYEITPIEFILIEGQLVDESNTSMDGKEFEIKIVPFEAASKNALGSEVRVSNDGKFEATCLSNNTYSVFLLHGKDTMLVDTLAIALADKKNIKREYVLVVPNSKKVSVDSISVIDTVAAVVVVESIQQTVYFATNVSDVGPASKAELRQIVAYLGLHPEAILTIEGHTDGSGPESINMLLALKRANSVKAYFELKGVAASRMSVVAFGSKNPVASNDTEVGRSKNRRVTIRVQ